MICEIYELKSLVSEPICFKNCRTLAALVLFWLRSFYKLEEARLSDKSSHENAFSKN